MVANGRIISATERVIEAAIGALEALRGTTATQVEASVQIVARTFGKVVVTGMGKAGLIGQKISATMRSTGQPSAFLDPAQALHGDMGMLSYGDALIALSNSGKTDEVIAVAGYCRARSIPVIAITSGAESELATIADVALVYPIMPEGCPIRRAPMASCMMMLAIGDAIAAELMTARGFTEADFLALHHGGYLGRVLAEDLAR